MHNTYVLIIKKGSKLVKPIWEFLRSEVATDEFVCSYLTFMDEYADDISNTTALACSLKNDDYDTMDTLVFESYSLYSLVEFLRYIMYSYNRRNDMNVTNLDAISDSSIIYAFDSYQDTYDFYTLKINKAIFKMSISIDREYMMPRPDYPFRSFWTDRTLKCLKVEPCSPAPMSVLNIERLFENVWIEQIEFTSHMEIAPNDVRSMFNNTRCRTVKFTFTSCGEDYKLSIIPFTGIHFTSIQEYDFSGSSYVTIEYRRPQGVCTERLFAYN